MLWSLFFRERQLLPPGRPPSTTRFGSPKPTLQAAPLYFDAFSRCQALRFLHNHDIVHRNIKSPNVLLDYRGTAKISDFNLANISVTVNGDTGGGFHSNVSSDSKAGRNVCAVLPNS